MITLACSDGARYRGHTVQSTIRRVWGRRARLRYSPDPNSPHVGYVLTPADPRTGASWRVMAQVAWIDNN